MKTAFILALCIATILGQRSPPRNPPSEPKQDQRCAGRNYNGRRCCTPENPCDYGEGDCDGPGDGGANDGHAGCKGDLVCGSNNCKKFGSYYHEKDDCCDLPESLQTTTPEPQAPIDAPLTPAPGQKCAGRNYNGKRCCTPEDPCDEGEGDCDGPGDGGLNDGHRGCKPGLVCGSNNCLKFGAYYHPKDDCCERPSSNTQFDPISSGGVRQQEFGWKTWGEWSACTATRCGTVGTKSRFRQCVGNKCGTSAQHTREDQTRPCEAVCNDIFT